MTGAVDNGSNHGSRQRGGGGGSGSMIFYPSVDTRRGAAMGMCVPMYVRGVYAF